MTGEFVASANYFASYDWHGAYFYLILTKGVSSARVAAPSVPGFIYIWPCFGGSNAAVVAPKDPSILYPKMAHASLVSPYRGVEVRPSCCTRCNSPSRRVMSLKWYRYCLSAHARTFENCPTRNVVINNLDELFWFDSTVAWRLIGNGQFFKEYFWQLPSVRDRLRSSLLLLCCKEAGESMNYVLNPPPHTISAFPMRASPDDIFPHPSGEACAFCSRCIQRHRQAHCYESSYAQSLARCYLDVDRSLMPERA